FREILRKAVHCRLRSVAPAAVFLSGGLDSSSIVGVAARLAREGRVPGPGFEAYSLDFARADADERGWVDDVAGVWELAVRHVSADDADPPSLAEQVADLRDFPDLPNTHPWGLLLAEARRRGARTALWGYGGDEWLTGDTAHCADLLRRLRLVALVRRVQDDIRSLNLLGGPPVGLRDAIRWCVMPLVARHRDEVHPAPCGQRSSSPLGGTPPDQGRLHVSLRCVARARGHRRDIRPAPPGDRRVRAR